MVLDILPEAGEALRQEAVLVAEIGMELLRREVWSAIEHNDEFQQCRHLVVRAPLSVERPRSPAACSRSSHAGPCIMELGRSKAFQTPLPPLDHLSACQSAVTSISIRIWGSANPAEIIMAAGRTSPKYFRRIGQH